MKEKRHTTPLEPPAEREAPYFGEEATVQARPVVPLEAIGDEPASLPEPVGDARPGIPPRARVRPLRNAPLALVLVSLLAGVVIGGAGFYFVQKERRRAASVEQAGPAPATQAEPVNDPPPEASAAEETAQVAPADAPPAPVTEPADDAGGEGASAPPRAEKPEAGREEPKKDAAETKKEVTEPKKGREEPRRETASAAGEGEPKRGKRGGVVDEAGSDEDGTRPAESRPVESGDFSRPRRAERRAERRERRRSVDSVRSIFEGRP